MTWRDGLLSLLGAVGVNGVCRKLLKKQPRILMFHKIYPVEATDNHSGFIDAAMFREILCYLKENYNLYMLKDLVAYRQKHGEFPDHSAVLTFDDGYKSFKDIALPILESLEAPATIFICPELVDNSETIWPDQLESAFEAGRTSLTDRDELRTLTQELKKLNSGERQEKILGLLTQGDVIDATNENSMLMDWGDLRLVAQNPLVEIGSHSLTHAILANESIECARNEIFGSKALIEERVGKEVFSFCYPNGQEGDFRESDVKSLQEAGYSCAVTSEFGLPSQDTSEFKLPRFGGDFELMSRARKYIDGVELVQRKVLGF